MSKQIAAQLNLSEVTVKIHRGQLMKKMVARSVPCLVGKAEALGVDPYRAKAPGEGLAWPSRHEPRTTPGTAGRGLPSLAAKHPSRRMLEHDDIYAPIRTRA